MIHLEKDMPLLEHPHLRVAAKTGNYEDTALVKCYEIENPDIENVAYQAQYIRYGNLVYHFNDPKELGEKLLTVDPESTHAAASFVRISNELLAQMTSGDLQESSLERAIEEEQALVEDPSLEEEIEEAEEEIDTQQELEDTPTPTSPSETASSTDEIGVPSYQETTTPSVLGTSTVPTAPVIEATSTPTAIPESIIDPIVPEAEAVSGAVSLVRKRKSLRKKIV